jgi:DNA-binding MarR family transcriptional regulator
MPTQVMKQNSGNLKPNPTFRVMLRTLGLVRRAMEPFFAQHGISGSQWGVLRVLSRVEDEGQPGIRLRDLSDLLLIRPPSVTGVVDRLQRLGLVERRQSETDQRARLVSLTTAGRRLVDQVTAGHADRIHEVLGVLSAPEQKQLHALLERLADHLDPIEHHQDAINGD